MQLGKNAKMMMEYMGYVQNVDVIQILAIMVHHLNTALTAAQRWLSHRKVSLKMNEEEGAMACENCRYWDAVYAPYIHKMIMACTKEGKESSMGTCKYFKRKLPDIKNKEAK